MKRTFVDIKEIVGVQPSGVLRLQGAEMASTGTVRNAWLTVEDGLISAFGPMDTLPEDTGEKIDCAGSILMPAFCDSHSHVVYAGSREGEFRDKIEGLSYAEIAARVGGILNSADLLHNTS